MTKESRPALKLQSALLQPNSDSALKHATRGTRESCFPAGPLHSGHECPPPGHPRTRPPPPGGLGSRGAAAGDFESGGPATAAANASSGSGRCWGGRRGSAERSRSRSLPHPGSRRPQTPLLLLISHLPTSPT